MNENNNVNLNNINGDNNSVNVDNSANPAPYRAMGNMNTAISNPSMNINNAMDVNIASSGVPVNNVNSASNETLVEDSTPSVQTNAYIPKENEPTVKRSFVSNSDKPKKRTISLNLGKEFKIALLIIVVLLIFIFLLPLLPNFF